MSTRFLTAGELAALDKWYVIDATGQVLGRVATRAATILIGKHRPQYAPFLVSGNHVIIVNAKKIKLTGEKLDKKVYRWHTQYPGGLREVTARKVFESKPDRLIREAVLGMLPKNKLRKRLVKRLKVYLADQHPHVAQQQETLQASDTLNKVDVVVNVEGGGKHGQAGAVQHGIARALVGFSADLRQILKKAGFLTRDPRAKERKKYGQPGARKRFQFSKR